MALPSLESDKDVLKGLELAWMFEDVGNGAAPPGLLTKLKKLLVKHMKANYYIYQKEIKDEIGKRFLKQIDRGGNVVVDTNSMFCFHYS